MNCVELVERVTDYLEEALRHIDRSRVDGHLEACDDCRTYVGEVETMLQLMARLPVERPSHQLERALSEAYRRWTSSSTV